MCVCVCVCVCARARARTRVPEFDREHTQGYTDRLLLSLPAAPPPAMSDTITWPPALSRSALLLTNYGGRFSVRRRGGGRMIALRSLLDNERACQLGMHATKTRNCQSLHPPCPKHDKIPPYIYIDTLASIYTQGGTDQACICAHTRMRGQ